QVYSLSLHDALPISSGIFLCRHAMKSIVGEARNVAHGIRFLQQISHGSHRPARCVGRETVIYESNRRRSRLRVQFRGDLLKKTRSEEHTSELQSRGH